MTDLQKLLAFALRRRGLTIREVGKCLGIGEGMICALFNERPVPGVFVPRDMSPAAIEKLVETIMEDGQGPSETENRGQLQKGDRVQYSDEGALRLRPKMRGRGGVIMTKPSNELASVVWDGAKSVQRLHVDFLKLEIGD